MSSSVLQIFLMVLVLSGFGFSQTPNSRIEVRLIGYLVDIACATDPAQNSPGWALKHTRQCLLMPACVRSGYAVLTDQNELIRFDAKGNAEAQHLILRRHANNDWRIRVSGYNSAGEMAVSKIQLLTRSRKHKSS